MKGLSDTERYVEKLPEDTPFLDRIRDEARLLDLPVLLVVPVVLVAVFSLPRETRLALAFSYSDPTVVTAFTANYVHLTRPHLLSNLGGYLLLIIVAYLLALSNGNRARFYTALAVILLVVPIPLSYLNLAVPRPGIGLGFSGINMALLGFLLIEFAAYLERYFTTQFGVENAPAFFFAVGGFVAIPHADMEVGFGLVAISMGLAAVYSGTFLLSYRPSVAGIRASIGKQGYFELLVVVIILCPAFVAIAFPQNLIIESAIVNVYIHFVGFSIGFITVYLWVLIATSADPADALPVDS